MVKIDGYEKLEKMALRADRVLRRDNTPDERAVRETARFYCFKRGVTNSSTDFAPNLGILTILDSCCFTAS